MTIDLGEYSISESGRALRLTIPKIVVDNWDLKSGDKLSLSLDNGTLIISSPKNKRLSD